MKNPVLRARDRRALVLGLLVVTPVLLYQVAIAPYFRALAEVRAQVEVQRSLLSRELTALAEAPEYPARVTDASNALEAETDRLFAGPDALSAAAALVNYVGQAARTHRVLVEQSETRAAALAAPGVVTLQVEVRGRSDLQGLLEWLTGLEEGAKLVRVEEINIEQPTRRIGTGRDEEVLTFAAIVSGYGLAGELGANVTTIGGGP